MSKKIILFLSGLRPEAKEAEYSCPNGRKVKGRQTNEAPVLYLLDRHPNIGEIICVLTDEAKKTAWDCFRATVTQRTPSMEFSIVPMEEGEDFTKAPLTQILTRVQPGDEIMLETTGGFRNAVMDLLLLSRILSYTGVTVSEAVYSNFNRRRIEDVSGMIHMFDLVGGLQEMTSFGSVKRLQQYCRQQGTQDEKLQALLYAMNKLSESITLCRTGSLDETMDKFNRALEAMDGCDDPLMRALLPAFREKFGAKLTTPGLIKWCAENNMLQQALTLYRERIPEYLLEQRPDLVELKEKHPEVEPKKYQNRDSEIFLAGLVEMRERASRHTPWLEDHTEPHGHWDNRVAMLEDMRELLPQSCFRVYCSADQFSSIVADYYYILLMRNMVNHANDESAESEQLMGYLAETQHYKHPDDVTAEDIRAILIRSLEHLKAAKGKKNRRTE